MRTEGNGALDHLDRDLDLELSGMMETSVGELSVPVAVIVAESNRLGRRRRLLRRLRIAGTALTVAAVAAVGANTGLPVLEGGRPQGPAAQSVADPPLLPTAAGTGAGAGTGAPAAAPTGRQEAGPSYSPAASDSKYPLLPLRALDRPGDRTPPVSASDPAGLTAPNVRATLAGLLAELGDRTAVDYGKPYERTLVNDGYAVDLKYGSGEDATLEVVFGRTPLAFPVNGGPRPGAAPFSCGKDSGTDGNHPTMCVSGYGADGSWEMVEANDARLPGTFAYHVALWRPNGVVLEFYDYAALVDPEQREVHRTRHQPAVGPDAWRAVAESPAWLSYVSADGRFGR